MKLTYVIAAALFTVCSIQSVAAEDAAARHARDLLKEIILVDGHNDLPWAIRNFPAPGSAPSYNSELPEVIRNFAAVPGRVENYDLRGAAPGHTDLARLRRGGVSAQFWSVYTPGELKSNHVRTQIEQIIIALRMIARYPEDLQLALTVADVRAAKRAGRIASLLGMEGGHSIEDSLEELRTYHALGVRYMSLTHNTHTNWADSAAQLPMAHGGLTTFGEDVVREMNRLGMLVDLSHVADATMDDALRVSAAPVIFSHSNARALCDVPRNVPDHILKRVKANGGVVMVTFVAGFLDKDIAKATVARVADHIEYIRRVAGVEHVGLGGDFDGNTIWPEGLSDVSMYPTLFAELIRRGWGAAELRLVAGENVLRALGQAEAVAARLQATGVRR